MRKIGLVGGISWVSTIDYYKLINQGIQKELGGLNYAECIMYSINFGELQKLGWLNSYELLFKAYKTLQEANADCIVLCANTAHLFVDLLKKEISIPIIDIVLETAIEIKKHTINCVGLLGTKVTMEEDFFTKKLEQNNIEIIIPEDQHTRDYIQNTLKNELGKGVFSSETKSKYLFIISKMIDKGAQGIILACTEIPLFLKQEDIRVPIFNTSQIHSNAAINFAINK